MWFYQQSQCIRNPVVIYYKAVEVYLSNILKIQIK